MQVQLKLGHGKKGTVGVFDTPQTQTRGESVPDSVSDIFYWAGNDPLSGYVGGDTFPSLDIPEKLKKRGGSVF